MSTGTIATTCDRLSAAPASSRRAFPWFRLAAGVWLTLAVAVIGKSFVEPGRHTVYPTLAHASLHFWQDANMYEKARWHEEFRYSPTFAIAITPFALLPDNVGGAAWCLLGLLALFLASRQFVRDVLPGDWPVWKESLLLILVAVGATRGIWGGQSNALLLACVLAGLAATARGQFWRAAVYLAIPVYIKVWPLAIVLLLGWRWLRPLSVRFGVICLLLAAVPFLVKPWPIAAQRYVDWHAALTGPMQKHWDGYRDGWQLWEDTIGPVNQDVFHGLQLFTALAVAGSCWLRHRCGVTDRQYLTFALAAWAACQLLVGPGTERMTYGLLAPSLAWAILLSNQRPLSRSLAIGAWVCTALFCAGSLERALLPIIPWAKGIQPFGVVLFVIWLALFYRAESSSSSLNTGIS